MSDIEYTPTTERVRDRYRRDAANTGSQDPDPAAAFDRWLLKHDAEVRAEALESIRVYAKELMAHHGQTWDALHGQKLIQVLGDPPVPNNTQIVRADGSIGLIHGVPMPDPVIEDDSVGSFHSGDEILDRSVTTCMICGCPMIFLMGRWIHNAVDKERRDAAIADHVFIGEPRHRLGADDFYEGGL